jgi:hypothetical protein
MIYLKWKHFRRRRKKRRKSSSSSFIIIISSSLMQSSVGSLCHDKMLASMKNSGGWLSGCTIWPMCLSSSHIRILVMGTSYPSIMMTTSGVHCSQRVHCLGSSCRGKVGIAEQVADHMIDLIMCYWVFIYVICSLFCFPH